MNPQMASKSPMQSNGPQTRHDVHAPQMNPPPQSFSSPPPDRFNPYHQPMYGPIYSQGTAQSPMDPHLHIQKNSVIGHQPYRRNTAPSDGMHPDSYTAMYGTPHSNVANGIGHVATSRSSSTYLIFLSDTHVFLYIHLVC